MKALSLFAIATLTSFSTLKQAVAAPAPNLTIFNPSGYGADGGTVYLNADYQNRTRGGNISDGGASVGVGVGNADDVAIDFNYAINSFGANNNGGKFGDGGLSAKIHKRLSNDTSVAIGYNQIVTTGNTDYQKGSYYVSGTKVFATKANISEPFSRVAVTAGIGGGVFNRFDASRNPAEANYNPSLFGSVAVRISEPVSAIVEWTGQDLSAGVSIAPFKDVPLTITPAVRDITGTGDGARFSISAGYSFKF